MKPRTTASRPDCSLSTTPEQVKGNWVAEGRWKAHLAMDEKLAQQKAKQPKPKQKSYDPNSDRPVLKRGGSSDSPTSDSGGGRQRTKLALRASVDSTVFAGDRRIRPILKKSRRPPWPLAQTQATRRPSTGEAPSPSSAAQAENDPNRPTLRRGKAPIQATPSESSTSAADKTIASMDSAHGKLMATMAAIGKRSYPAISDAGAYETRSLMYSMNSTERANKADQLRAIAMDEIAKFIAKRKTPAVAKRREHYQLRSSRLRSRLQQLSDFRADSSLPVESAKALRGGEFDYYVTVVAREDINGTPIKIFSAVSDTNHLDSFPRMEMVDAVDADANGRGDLLFRQYSDVGISYGLYRVYPYDMQKVFEGGSSL